MVLQAKEADEASEVLSRALGSSGGGVSWPHVPPGGAVFLLRL